MDALTLKEIFSKKNILRDLRIALESRELSIIGRREVFMGKAKFGIFGDGKEIPQLAMAKFFKNGDWRSGYYRDQTFMFAIERLTLQQFFSQLYAHTSFEADPASSGRMMNAHFSTQLINEEGEWCSQTDRKNSSADISSTAAQVPRLLGLSYASKIYRNNKNLKKYTDFSINGNEVAFGTIGNAATSEGHFWETLNAAGVLQVPMVMSIWDDEYGISVPQKYHTVKESISEALNGFKRNSQKKGLEIYNVLAWDYPALIKTYQKAVDIARREHIPCLIHVTEATQPQGHSTSGSHERYKSKERLEWEKNHDCILKFKEWIKKEKIVNEDEIKDIEVQAKVTAKNARNEAWSAHISEIKSDVKEMCTLLTKTMNTSTKNTELNRLIQELQNELIPTKSLVVSTAKKALRVTKNEVIHEKNEIKQWLQSKIVTFEKQYNSHLYNTQKGSALNINTVPAKYSNNSPTVNAYKVINKCFDILFEQNPLIFALGEDIGIIGDVNQGFVGLQEKHGEIRITDTGIREISIIGQGIGAALRGLRPITEIQYLDYVIYGLQPLSDDLATLQYRTCGKQKAPLIIRTRGHRLEGIWHSGSPMSMLLGALRGIYIVTPRNMTQAAGFYRTLLNADDPALVIEPLNGYRLKEQIPDNLSEFQLALGHPEILQEGKDVTVVTYGPLCSIVMSVAKQLIQHDIHIEIIDVQTLIPFDRPKTILNSLIKTNRLVVIDEDVPGGASAYISQKILERDQGYLYLDSQPITITGKNHRPAYGSDGDYFSKPNEEEIFDKIYEMMIEVDPKKYPIIY